jgi:hypothetical protein
VAINDCYTNRNKAGQEQSIEIGLASMENELKKTDMTLMSLPHNIRWCGRESAKERNEKKCGLSGVAL